MATTGQRNYRMISINRSNKQPCSKLHKQIFIIIAIMVGLLVGSISAQAGTAKDCVNAIELNRKNQIKDIKRNFQNMIRTLDNLQNDVINKLEDKSFMSDLKAKARQYKRSQ